MAKSEFLLHQICDQIFNVNTLLMYFAPESFKDKNNKNIFTFFGVQDLEHQLQVLISKILSIDFYKILEIE